MVVRSHITDDSIASYPWAGSRTSSAIAPWAGAHGNSRIGITIQRH
jgi:hypothetical protein